MLIIQNPGTSQSRCVRTRASETINATPPPGAQRLPKADTVLKYLMYSTFCFLRWSYRRGQGALAGLPEESWLNWKKVEEDKCSPPTSGTRCAAERCTARITLKTDYTQWTWEQLNFEWMRKEKTTKKKKKKQNYVLSLIWGTFSRRKKKKRRVTQNVFLHYSWLLLACMIKQPHQRKYSGRVKSFLLLGCIFFFFFRPGL